MKKKRLIYFIILLTFLCGNSDYLKAQDSQPTKTEKKGSRFGSLMKKVGEATTGINMTNEPFVVNTLSTRFKVEFINCIGNSAEQKFQIFLKITNKGTNESNMCVGGNCTGKSSAVDNEGNNYKSNSCAGDCKDFPTDIPVKVMIEFEKVLPSIKSLEVIKLNVGNFGNIELRNIPINWDAVLAENTKTGLEETKPSSLTNSQASKYDIELVSCMGDIAKQHVEITLKVKNKSTNERICIGGNCTGKSMAVDSDGNSYKSESCAGDCIDLPTGINVKAVVGFNQILPTVKIFDYMKLNVGNGIIEIHNLTVNWK